MSLVHRIQQLLAHSRFPELTDVVSDAVQCLVVVWVSRKKLTDLVGHANQVIDIHVCQSLDVLWCGGE